MDAVDVSGDSNRTRRRAACGSEWVTVETSTGCSDMSGCDCFWQCWRLARLTHHVRLGRKLHHAKRFDPAAAAAFSAVRRRARKKTACCARSWRRKGLPIHAAMCSRVKKEGVLELWRLARRLTLHAAENLRIVQRPACLGQSGASAMSKCGGFLRSRLVQPAEQLLFEHAHQLSNAAT